MCWTLFAESFNVNLEISLNTLKKVMTMLNEKEVQQVILHTLDELRQTIKDSSKEAYTREELLQLLDQLTGAMT